MSRPDARPDAAKSVRVRTVFGGRVEILPRHLDPAAPHCVVYLFLAVSSPLQTATFRRIRDPRERDIRDVIRQPPLSCYW